MSLKLFLEIVINGSLIPKRSAHFNRYVSASVMGIVMALQCPITPLITMYKNNFSEIHISQGPERAFPSLSCYGSGLYLAITAERASWKPFTLFVKEIMSYLLIFKTKRKPSYYSLVMPLGFVISACYFQ